MSLLEEVGRSMGDAMARHTDMQFQHLSHVRYVVGCWVCSEGRLSEQLAIIEQPHFHLCCAVSTRSRSIDTGTE